MAEYAYRLLNAFAAEHLAGNPLSAFEDARGMDAAGTIFVAGRVIEFGRGTASN